MLPLSQTAFILWIEAPYKVFPNAKFKKCVLIGPLNCQKYTWVGLISAVCMDIPLSFIAGFPRSSVHQMAMFSKWVKNPAKFLKE